MGIAAVWRAVKNRAARRAWAVPVGVLLSVSAFADAEPAIERCRETASDAERIACLEAAIRELAGGSDAAAPVAESEADVVVDSGSSRSATETEAVPPDPSSVIEAQASVAEERVSASVLKTAADAPTAVEPAAPQADIEKAGQSTQVEVTEPAAEAPLPAVDEIGQQQVEARARSREEQLAGLEEVRGQKVARFEYVGYRKLQVRLENGQIWRQIRGDVQEIRVNVERNPTVDITESALGGYRLRLNEIRRTIRVRRIR